MVKIKLAQAAVNSKRNQTKSTNHHSNIHKNKTIEVVLHVVVICSLAYSLLLACTRFLYKNQPE